MDINIHFGNTLTIWFTLAAVDGMPDSACFSMTSNVGNFFGARSSLSHRNSCRNQWADFFICLYVFSARARRCLPLSMLTDRTCFNAQVSTTLRIKRVLKLLVLLWHTNFHTLMQLPAVASLSLKGTSPAKILEYFFSACSIPSVVICQLIPWLVRWSCLQGK